MTRMTMVVIKMQKITYMKAASSDFYLEEKNEVD